MIPEKPQAGPSRSGLGLLPIPLRGGVWVPWLTYSPFTPALILPQRENPFKAPGFIDRQPLFRLPGSPSHLESGFIGIKTSKQTSQ